jgi:hypothetical protein
LQRHPFATRSGAKDTAESGKKLLKKLMLHFGKIKKNTRIAANF